MNDLNVVQQTRVEKEMLKLLIEGLRNTLVWQIHGEDLSRKLSTLKFVMRSFQNHMERLMRLEERDGYMDIVLEKQPHLSKSVEVLRGEHDEFRREISLIAAGLERVLPTDQNTLNTICDQVAGLLKKVDVHTQKEADLFQEAFERENGGEG
jgi:hemerythrin-like domain-containing protein